MKRGSNKSMGKVRTEQGHKFDSKINYDKYYTPREISKYCINKTFEILNKYEISEIIEPSAGNGSFSKQIKNCIAYDIEPESQFIIKQDFLKLVLGYKKGRLFIGNPPFGARNTLAKKFYEKCCSEGDYIAFILPISQYNNNYQFYKFDLIHSEIIDSKHFINLDDRIKLTFNIYKRPKVINDKPSYKMQSVNITDYRRGGNSIVGNYDIGICSWGNAIGKETEYVGQYAQELYVEVEETFRDDVIKLIKNTDFKNDFFHTSTPKLQVWRLEKYIKENIKGIS